MKHKGFSLLELLFSMAVFSVVTVITFNAWTAFMKASVKNETKNDANSKLLTIYKDVNRFLSASSLIYFESAREVSDDTSSPVAGLDGDEYKKKRWFFFLISRDFSSNDGNGLSSPINYKPQSNNSNALMYNTAVLYYLDMPENDTCDGFEYCPHKRLNRKTWKLGQDIYKDKKTYTFSSELRKLQSRFSDNSIPAHIVERDIVDLWSYQLDSKVNFHLVVLREDEAKREFQMGKEKLTNISITEYSSTAQNISSKASKYVEELSWISIPGNTPK